MSRLDYFTLAVVAICILAIGFLLYKTSDLLSDKTEKDPKEEVMDALKEMGIEEDTAYTEPVVEDDVNGENKIDEEQVTTASKDNATKEEVDYSENTSAASKPASEKIQKTETAPVKPAAPAAATSKGEFLVVAGSFKLRHNAENEAKRLQKMGYTNASVETFNKGALATLVVDRFANDKDAASLVSELKNKNIPSYVHRKREGE
ncbi:MAG TPA: SPOR domain-containing protein [Saprospiraceae bacterium]|nr:SPOR domain-containing protein [Saprospiraceae bacterium]